MIVTNSSPHLSLLQMLKNHRDETRVVNSPIVAWDCRRVSEGEILEGFPIPLGTEMPEGVWEATNAIYDSETKTYSFMRDTARWEEGEAEPLFDAWIKEH